MKTAKTATRARASRPSSNAARPSSSAAPTLRTRPSTSAAPTLRTRLRLNVQYATRSRTVPAEARLRTWVRAALRADAEITVRLVGLREGRELNRTYRGKD